MIPLPMALQAYSPQIELGDWQIVVFVDRRRGRLLLERWHSSERNSYPMADGGQVLRIDTGIRAFRRQMPVLAAALEAVPAAGMGDAEVIHAVFEILASVYKAAPGQEEPGSDGESLPQSDCADFFVHRERAALAALG